MTYSVSGTCFTLSGAISEIISFTMGMLIGATCFTDFFGKTNFVTLALLILFSAV